MEGADFVSIKRATSLSRGEFIYACVRACDLKFDRAFRNVVNKRNYEV